MGDTKDKEVGKLFKDLLKELEMDKHEDDMASPNGIFY